MTSCLVVLKNRNILHVILVLSVVTWLIMNFLEPGGGSIIWFLVLLSLTLLNYYLGFVDKSTNPFRFYAQAGFFIFLGITLLMAYLVRVESEGLKEISRYIAPYPNVKSISFIPRTSDRTVQHWQIKTDDPVGEIRKFYSLQENLRDWKIVTDHPVIVLEKDNYKLNISISEYPRLKMNMIFYYLEYKQ